MGSSSPFMNGHPHRFSGSRTTPLHELFAAPNQREFALDIITWPEDANLPRSILKSLLNLAEMECLILRIKWDEPSNVFSTGIVGAGYQNHGICSHWGSQVACLWWSWTQSQQRLLKDLEWQEPESVTVGTLEQRKHDVIIIAYRKYAFL